MEPGKSEDSKETPLPDSCTIENFTRDGFKTLMECIRHANALPQDDYSFYNIQDSFKNIMNNEGDRILSQMNNILRKNNIKSNMKTSILDHKTELLIESNDTILERVADNIDEMNGIKKHSVDPVVTQSLPPRVNGAWNRTTANSNENSTEISNLIQIDTRKNTSVLRPQLEFSEEIDNSRETPWEPRIKDKPNSLKPLAIFLERTERGEEFSHPYEFELEKFVVPEAQLLPETPIMPKSLEVTKLVYIDSANQLDDLVEDLRKYKVIAVDLEHHSYRTFMGITCLMQISTGDTDYIIDTLKLRRELHVLNEIFTKSSILKVFHGAGSDVLWLQRDLSLYVVNMFDTFHAAKILEYTKLSLSYLMKRFLDIDANKHFQLADWRVRPLAKPLLDYAREDTHYLIYIYQNLKSELLKKAGGNDNLLITAFNRSTNVCMQRYMKPIWNEDVFLNFYKKCNRIFNNRQLTALRELYNWRDNIARQEDESIGYVLPANMLLQISQNLPREMQGILACCNPVPPIVRSKLLEIHHIILKARDQPLEKTILQEDARAKGSTIKLVKFNIESPLYCPHDLSQNKDIRENLPTLLDTKDRNIDLSKILDIENTETSIDIFGNSNKTLKKPVKPMKFLSPFERYQLVKTFVQDEAKKTTEIETVEESQETNPSIQEENANSKDINEERLESIKKYFEKLSKKTQEEIDLAKEREEKLYQKVIKIEEERSLMELGGTKKRKREEQSISDVKIETDSSRDQYIHSNKKQKRNDNNEKTETNRRKHQTPVKQNRKRKHDDGNFQSFDYSSVDFKQFQGGAGSVNEGKKINSNFRNKGKKKNKKGFNKSGMFSNSRRNK